MFKIFKTFSSVTGPREPVFFVKTTPNTSPKSDFSDTTTAIITDSEDEEGDSTATYAAKISKEQTRRPFKFRDLSELNAKKNYSPTSSPIPLPSPEVYTISSDEELENSMIELGNNIDNGM